MMKLCPGDKEFINNEASAGKESMKRIAILAISGIVFAVSTIGMIASAAIIQATVGKNSL